MKREGSFKLSFTLNDYANPEQSEKHIIEARYSLAIAQNTQEACELMARYFRSKTGKKPDKAVSLAQGGGVLAIVNTQQDGQIDVHPHTGPGPRVEWTDKADCTVVVINTSQESGSHADKFESSNEFLMDVLTRMALANHAEKHPPSTKKKGYEFIGLYTLLSDVEVFDIRSDLYDRTRTHKETIRSWEFNEEFDFTGGIMPRRSFVCAPNESSELVEFCEEANGVRSIEDLAQTLMEHAVDGASRSGAWEREWLQQAIG